MAWALGLSLGLALSLTACKPATGLSVRVTNPTELDRHTETVTLLWAHLLRDLPGLTPENVVVLDPSGAQVPAQVLPGDGTEPLELLFQVKLGAKEARTYTVDLGTPQAWPNRLLARHVPERKDDFAWENNVVAYRMYGPALNDESKSVGIDIWVKNVERLVTAPGDWFTRNYHQDLGEGMDCYKVGPTLGCGATAPFADGALWTLSNYSTWEVLESGPVRVTFRLTYDALPVGEGTVKMEKIISLDYDQYLSRMETRIVEATGTPVPALASGIVIHALAEVGANAQALRVSEVPSDSKAEDPRTDGLIHQGLVLPAPSATEAVTAADHLLFIQDPGQAVVCYSGAAWSKAAITSTFAWQAYLDTFAAMLNRPLEVKIGK